MIEINQLGRRRLVAVEARRADQGDKQLRTDRKLKPAQPSAFNVRHEVGVYCSIGDDPLFSLGLTDPGVSLASATLGSLDLVDAKDSHVPACAASPPLSPAMRIVGAFDRYRAEYSSG